jgi:hypothetical protein
MASARQTFDCQVDRYLRKLRLPNAAINVVPLMNMDSLEMTDHDRVLLLGMVRAILKENAPIIITPLRIRWPKADAIWNAHFPICRFRL